MSESRATMNKKPVYEVPAKTVINFQSGFAHKLLCDGPTFSTGSACAYSCAFCYVPDLMRKSPHMAAIRERHEEVVVRRRNALEILRSQLVDAKRRPKFNDPNDRRVIYSSPLVDVANMDLVRETIEACKIILELTHWQIRLLSKSNLLPIIARELPQDRMIYGVSTGTLDDNLARSFEQGTPLPSKRIASLHWLQDNGYRTFGMICPSLPQHEYDGFAREMRDAICTEKCEHVWAEIINVRGESMTRTAAASFFNPVQLNAKSLFNSLQTMAWDLAHWRVSFDILMIWSYRESEAGFPIPHFLSFDRRFVRLTETFRLRGLIYSAGRRRSELMYSRSLLQEVSDMLAPRCHAAFYSQAAIQDRRERATSDEGLDQKLCAVEKQVTNELMEMLATVRGAQPCDGSESGLHEEA